MVLLTPVINELLNWPVKSQMYDPFLSSIAKKMCKGQLSRELLSGRPVSVQDERGTLCC